VANWTFSRSFRTFVNVTTNCANPLFSFLFFLCYELISANVANWTFSWSFRTFVNITAYFANPFHNKLPPDICIFLIYCIFQQYFTTLL
jgi:hypothetical protein